MLPLFGKQIEMLLNFKGSLQGEMSQVSVSLYEGLHSPS